jgi:hypothetical protein
MILPGVARIEARPYILCDMGRMDSMMIEQLPASEDGT